MKENEIVNENGLAQEAECGQENAAVPGAELKAEAADDDVHAEEAHTDCVKAEAMYVEAVHGNDVHAEDFYLELADYAAEGWRLCQYTKALLGKVLNPQIQKRGMNQVKRFDKHSSAALEKLGIEVLDFAGEVYNTGLPVYPINLEDFEAEDELRVEVTLEPTIKRLNSAEILKKGSVVVGRINNEILCGN